QSAGVGLPDFNGYRNRLIGCLSLEPIVGLAGRLTMLKLGPQFLENGGRLFQRSRTTHETTEALDLVTQRLLISGQFGGKARCLRHHESAQTEDDREPEKDHDEHGRRARNSQGIQTYDKR